MTAKPIPPYQVIDARAGPSAGPLPAHLPPKANEFLVEAEDAFRALVAKAPAQVRELSLHLFEAALVAAIHGEQGIGKEFARRARKWGAGRKKRYTDEVERFWTAHAVKRSNLPKSRGSRAKNAFEEVGEQRGISSLTAEKRRYRKPRT
jgi:hypothetical protein